MTSIELSFYGLGCFVSIVAYYGIKRYHTPLNPLTIFAIIQIGLFTIISGIVAMMTPVAEYTSDDIIKTIMISIVYLGAVTLPYLFRGYMLSNLFGKGLVMLGLNADRMALHFSFSKFILFLAGAAVSLIALAICGGGGMLWLTNTREAYITYRAGAGPFFVLTQWFLMCALLYYLWTTKTQIVKLVFVLLFFSIVMYFLGSKNNILMVSLVGAMYYNFYIKKIPALVFPVVVFLVLLEFFILLLAQGSYESFLAAGFYFRDYFDTTTQFISRFEEFGFQYGRGWLSSLWFYVPRGLYPDKPYEYGFTLIHKVLFPGAAEIGLTPGLLQWSLAYMDFGVIGVFVYGLLIGVWQKITYEYFLKHKQKLFAFILGLQFAIWPIWPFASILLVVVMSIVLSIILKLTWRFSDFKSFSS